MSLPHNLRLRPDLVLRAQDDATGKWVVKDPVSLRFFLFGADEHFILQRLTGAHTVEEILNDFSRERAPRQMTAARLQAFLAGLCRNGLATSDAPHQGPLMLERGSSGKWRESLLGWTNLLAIRLPGVNPDAWLDWVYPAVRWCFSWWFAALSLCLWAVAAVVAITHAGAMTAQWPRLSEFLSGGNLLWLAVALAGTKVIHELAHAFTCKHFGGRCHEIGLMLLVFTPCLYCNVTDAWMLRSRSRRIAISAAGILTELQLAALAILVWRFTQPGPLNSLALNVIVVCSVGTLLFNGNPLLKYDGYYVLSDLVGIPNLWQESRSYLYGRLGHWLLGRTAPDEQEHAGRHTLLIAYAVASIAYRVCLTFAIFLFLYRLLHPLGLDLPLLFVAGSLVLQTGVAWATPLARWWRDPMRSERLKKVPLAMVLLGAAAALALVGVMPLPCAVTAPAVLEPATAQRVFVATPGVLVDASRVGEHIEAGEPLARLENADLLNEQLRIAGDLSRAKARVEALESRASQDDASAAQLLVAKEILADLSKQARLRGEEAAGLTLRAPLAGEILPPPAVIEPNVEGRSLPGWSGGPLDADNAGCYLQRGDLLCLVGDGQDCEAIVLVDETEVPYVRVGQTARLKLAHAPGQILTAEVKEIAEINAATAPEELAGGGDIATRRDATGRSKLVRTAYQVRLAIDPSATPRLIGARGSAKIEVEPQTIVARILRWARRTWTIEPVAQRS